MSDSDTPDPPPGRPLEIEVEPSVVGRLARWTERARILRTSVESARTDHASVDLGFTLVERDSAIGGGLLAGALAYRLFVLLLPTALLFVSGLGLYADTVDTSPGKVAEQAGLHGLIASEVASTASSNARWIVFILMVPAVLYALAKLYRAIAIVHALVWHGSGRGSRTTPKGVGILGVALLVDLGAAEVVGWIRRHDQLGGISALAVYLVVVGGAWLLVSMQLPHRDVRWPALVPGALLVGAGLLFVNVFNVYVTTRLVEDRANTYGALGIAAALLLSLVLVGRVIIVSAELNASLADRRRPGPR
jgi:membrane protein